MPIASSVAHNEFLDYNHVVIGIGVRDGLRKIVDAIDFCDAEA